MKVTTQIIFKDYLKLHYVLIYQKPRVIIYLFISVIILLFFLPGLITGEESFTENWYILLPFAFMILLPLAIYRNTKKGFYTHLALQEPTTYEFSPDKMTVQREGLYAEVAWNKVYKVAEYNNWFLIYQSNKLANILPKYDFSTDQIAELRFILNSVPDLKKKLKQ